jgi:rod shape-determining protein MreC
LGTLKSLLQRFAFVSLIIATFALMLIGKADTVLVERARIAVTDAVTPILQVMAQPAQAIAAGIANIRELAAIRRENAVLRAENARLLQWQSVAQRLDSQNRNLTSLLAVVPEPPSRFVTARVVADTGGAYAQSVIITAGHAAGVAKGQVVMSGEGLVGRVMQAGQNASRVLLITDINSRLPVVVGEARARAIMAGDNGGRPRLLYLSEKTAVAPGDKVMTSGDADAFPMGLPIGQVVRNDDGVIEVEPYMSGDKLLYVRVFDFGLAGTTADVSQPADGPIQLLVPRPKPPEAAPATDAAAPVTASPPPAAQARSAAAPAPVSPPASPSESSPASALNIAAARRHRSAAAPAPTAKPVQGPAAPVVKSGSNPLPPVEEQGD